jgi:RNAse (barnase) inhibitor barstar
MNRVRENWCRRPRHKRPVSDRKNIIVVLDGSRVTDIPSFHIALGEAVNGPNGYYGGCLDAMADCLCGRFGLKAPFTLEIIGLEQVRNTLDSTEEIWRQWRQDCYKRDYPEDWEEDQVYITAVTNGEIEEPEDEYANYSYFDMILHILTKGGVTVREHGEASGEKTS